MRNQNPEKGDETTKTNPKPDLVEDENDPKIRTMHRAVRFLAMRDNSRQELRDKLKKSKTHVDMSVINEVLDYLEAKGVLKPGSEVAKQLVPSYQRQRKGSRWIENKLRSKGITLSSDEKKDMGIDDHETDLRNAREMLMKKFKSTGPFKEHKERAKAMRALASRGFPMDIIIKAIKGSQEFDESY